MNFLTRLRLRARLALVFSIILGTFAIVVGVALVGTNNLAEVDAWNTHTYRVIAAGDQAMGAMVDMETGARGYLLAGREEFLQPWKAGLAGFEAAWARARELTADNPEQQRRLDAMKARHLEFKAIGDQLIDLRRDPAAGEAVANAFAAGKDKAAMDAFRALHKEFVGVEARLLDERELAKAGTRDRLDTALVGGLTLALLAGIALGALVIRSIMQQVGGEPLDAARLAGAVADGDLSTPIHVRPGDDASLVAALKRMQDKLSGIVAGVRQNADLVATASTQIAQGNNDLSSRTEEQASALQQTAASMKQLSTTVRQNADNARQGNDLAVNASGIAARGGEVVGQVVETMKGINESSRRIADIIGVIDGIAFQTNILALNAAVEAARAGDQGRGFAVVASEVRNLAQRSADAAKEIKVLINASVERVGEGSTLVDQAGTTMNEVVDAIRRVTDLMGDISAASVEQTSGVGQVDAAVQQMDQATQQNAALVEESAAAAASLQGQAQQLVESVSVFRLATAGTVPLLGAPAANASVVHRPPFGQQASARKPAPRAPVADGGRTGTDDWQTF